MTKEEYQQKLQTDYWKGYSYALIKERDFTCQDCGRKFYNQRHLLNVHHLRYKDADPWAYDKHDLVVLCRECHEKRHGIYHDNEPHKRRFAPPQFEKSVPPRFDQDEDWVISYMSKPDSHGRGIRRGKSLNNGKIILIVFVVVAFLFFLFSLFILHDNNIKVEEDSVTQSVEELKTKPHSLKKSKDNYGKKSDNNDGQCVINSGEQLEPVSICEDGTVDISSIESNIAVLEKKNHESVQNAARREGVSTEGSTSEILDRINRKHMDGQAKKEGTSTDGSTIDISSINEQ